MFIKLSFKSGTPAYLQIVEQVKYSAASGTIRPGEALPSIRILAEQLRINRNTVAKAYSELEHQGVIEIIQGKGAFLSSQTSPFNDQIRSAVLNEAIDSVIVQAHHFQISRDQLLDRIRQRLDEFENQQEDCEHIQETKHG